MLLDHFSGALERVRDWHGFHQMWAIMLVKDLNQCLPEGWFAEPNVQFLVKTDVVAVEIYAPDRPRRLAGAIEIVSPSNKDRPESRESFVAKCERYLQTELGVLVIDIVTERHADLHHALLERLDAEEMVAQPGQLFACSYRPRLACDRMKVELWHSPLRLAEKLPTLPLYLHDGPVLPIELEKTYLDSCRALRIPNP